MVSCEKGLDYRDKFVGKYQCFYSKVLVGEVDGVSMRYTILLSNDTLISVTKSDVDSEIVFLDWYLTIEEDGSITSARCLHGSSCTICPRYSSPFKNDSIVFYNRCGPLGSAYIYECYGGKIE